MVIKAIIFDMDGVIIDSEPAHLVSANIVLAKEGANLSEEDNEVYLGWNEKRYWTDLVARFNLSRSVDDYIVERHELLLGLLRQELPIAKGIESALLEAQARGLKIGLASSAEMGLIQHVVDKGGLLKYFDSISSGDEVRNSKPDPEIFLLAADRLNVAPKDCLVFEDSLNGVAAAQEAGMQCVRVVTHTTRNLKFSEVFATIDGFEDFDLDYLLDSERTKK